MGHVLDDGEVVADEQTRESAFGLHLLDPGTHGASPLRLRRRTCEQLLQVRESAYFVAILFLIDLIEEIRRFSPAGAGLRRVAGLAGLNIVASVYAILPLITLLAAIALFLGLSRSSELVAIRAAGRSGLRIVAAPVVTALLLGALLVAVLTALVLVALAHHTWPDAVPLVTLVPPCLVATTLFPIR